MVTGVFAPKSERETLTDELLTLALLALCARFTRNPLVGDRLKVTKLVFLPTYSLYRKKHKGFNLSFYKYNWGLFTKELYEIWDDLSSAGLLEVLPGPSSSIRLTEAGIDFGLQFFKHMISTEANAPFTRALLETASGFGHESTHQLLRYIYSLPISPVGSSKETSVSEIALGVYLTERIPEEKAQSVVQIQEEWLIRYDLLRQRGWCKEDQPSALIDLHSPELILQIHEALQSDIRGEGRKISLEELEQELGIR